VALSLPADLEPHGGPDKWHNPAVYALRVSRPDDPAAAWDRQYDNRPPWWDEFIAADHVIYVGATGDCLSRLEDHRDGEVRQASLLKICEIDSLRNVWWYDNPTRAFERESGIALMMQHEYANLYIHSR